jgi:hypothetical protein
MEFRTGVVRSTERGYLELELLYARTERIACMDLTYVTHSTIFGSVACTRQDLDFLMRVRPNIASLPNLKST